MSQNASSILIVNSEADIASLFAEILLMDDEKYIITTAHSGNECLLALRHNIPDLILLDIELLDMNGWDLIGNIRRTGYDIPLIIISARSPDITQFSKFNNISDYLMMPVTIDGLLLAVKDAVKVPLVLNKCLETVRMSGDKDISLLEKNIRLIKQSIIDRKLLVLMRQIHPKNKIDPVSKRVIDNLKEKIDMARNEIENFKKRESLWIDISGGKWQRK